MALLAYYKLDETNMNSPHVAADSSGNSNDGVYNGPWAGAPLGFAAANAVVVGVSGNAMEVDVTPTYPDPADIQGHAGMQSTSGDFAFPGTSPFTVEFYVKLGNVDPLQRRALVGNFDPATPPLDYASWGFYIEPEPLLAGAMRIWFFRGSFAIAPDIDVLISPPLMGIEHGGTWHQLRGIYNGTHMYLYVDNVLVGSMLSTVTDLSASAQTLSVGAGVPLQVIFGFRSFRYPPFGTAFDEVKISPTAVQGDSATIGQAFRSYDGVAN